MRNTGFSTVLLILIIAALVVGGYFILTKKEPPISKDTQITKDYESAKVPMEDIVQGCLGGKDCIPSIDSPIYESADVANNWLNGEDIVFGVIHNDEVKAYPQRIMNWHEIVNDKFGSDQVAITFCPLCGTAVAFHAQVNGKDSEFGVSGKLYNSDLIMYDRNEGNYWQQATGEAIVGPAARRDEYLEMLSTTTATWKQWEEKYQDTLVLSRDTGFTRDYDQYPYGTYEEDGNLIFGVQNTDDENRLHPKAIVYGIVVDDKALAVSEEALSEDSKTIILGDDEIEFSKTSANEVMFRNVETSEEIVPLRGFWFAWVAFNPDTQLFSN